MDPYVQSAIALLGPLVGIWLGILLSERKTYRERGWDLKAQAYSAIFEALEKMRRSMNRALQAEVNHREQDEAEERQDNEQYRATREELFIRLARESWILPVAVHDRLTALERRLARRHDSYFDSIDDGHAALKDAVMELRKLARRDMATRHDHIWSRLLDTNICENAS